METPESKYFLDGMDLWSTFKVFVEGGSDDFLKIPERKSSIEHEWLDEDGTDVDLSRTFFKSRTINLKCVSLNDNAHDFWLNFNKLIATFRKPGPRRLSVTRHKKDYFIYYKDNNTADTYNTFRIGNSGKIARRFTITIVEPKPAFDTAPQFITDEQNRFLIT